MRSGNLRGNPIRKIISVLIGITVLAIAGYAWYRGGFMIVSESYRVEDVTIYNTIYMLDAGDNVKQGFEPRDTFLSGIDVMMVNTSQESTGDVVVQVLDMWGEPIGEGRLPLAEVSPGTYATVPMKVELDFSASEEFQICVFTQEADIVPGVLLVSSQEDVEDNNDLCYYNEERVWDNGLVVGYNYGHEKFFGYEYKTNDEILITVVEIVGVLFLGLFLIYLTLTFRQEQLLGLFLDFKLFRQFSIIASFLGIFFLAAMVHNAGRGKPAPAWAYLIVFLPLVIFLWTILLYLRGIRRRTIKRDGGSGVDICFGIITVLCLLTRIPMLTDIQRWDGAIYYSNLYKAGINFDFTLSCVWNYFKLANHPTFAYTFFMLIGEFLFPGRMIGVLLVVLVMSNAALICIYHMLRRYWCRMPVPAAFLCTVILSLTPLFWGTWTFISVDYTLLLFFVFLMYADFKEQKIMMVFWTVALLLNKESGWMLAAGYYIVYLFKLWKAASGKTVGQRLAAVLSDGMVRIMATGVLIVCVYMILQGGAGWYGLSFASAELIAERGRNVQAFGFYPAYMLYKLKQMFVLDFAWIPTLLLAACALVHGRRIRKGMRRRKGKIRNTGEIIGALLLFTLFNMMYITATLPRYTVCSSVILWLLALIFSYYLLLPALPGIAAKVAVPAIILVLVIQNFIFIDPLSNLLFMKRDTGKGIILDTNMSSGRPNDSVVNNYRYRHVDDLLDQLLADAGYSERMAIVGWEGETVNAMWEIPLGWDTQKKKRVALVEDTAAGTKGIIPLNLIPQEELAAGAPIGQEVIFFFLPYFGYDEEEYLASLREHYQVSERREVSNWGGTLSYYVLSQR